MAVRSFLILYLCISLFFGVHSINEYFPYDPALEYHDPPPGYMDPCYGYQGKITTENYIGVNGPNRLLVYTPFGYDPAQRYDIFYFMHGGGDDETKVFGPDVMMQNLFDHLIKDKVMKPMIVVTPTFTKTDSWNFWYEWVESVIPFVESKYSTYALNTTRVGIAASRKHRAFGGFSMGSVTTWAIFKHSLTYCAYFMPLSGNSMDGSTPQEMAQNLVNAIWESGLTTRDYFILTATGTDDMAGGGHRQMIEAMHNHPEFVWTSDLSVGNSWFVLANGGYHYWNWIKNYINLLLPYFFHEE